MKDVVDTYSPTGVLEDYFRSSGSETSPSTDTFSQLLDSEAHQKSKSTSKWHGLAKLLKTNSKKPLASTAHPIRKLTKRMSRSMRENTAPFFQSDVDSFNPFKSSWRNFSLKELWAATKSFSQENLIGKGGYSEVYKGCLQNGQPVAVKRLTRGKPEEIDGFFLSEIGMMAHVNHPNTARLMGYCVEGGMYLFVLELSTKGSLASLLFGASKEKLEWEVRYKIALGVARGLKYLHEDCQRRIIHRDIKATNILLTDDFEAKICDFGLAKWLPEKWTHHTESSAEGTFGYLAPELLHDCIVDEKTDVYAFGVLLLELVTRRRALDYSQQSLIVWARPLLKKNQIKDLVDPSLADEYNRREVNLTLLVASLCIRASPTRRPSMGQVLQLLSGDLCCFKCMKKYRVKLSRRLLQLELINVEDHELIQESEDLHLHSRTSSSSGTFEDMSSPLEKVTLKRLLDHGYES